MNYKLGFIVLICTTFSNADAIHIPSTATPEGMSIEQYNELSASLKQTDGGQKDFNTAKANTPLKAKAETDVKRKADLEPEIEAERSSAAQKANEAAAMKKAEAKKIASSAKRDFENKIKKAWILPENTSGQKAIVRVFLTESGAVSAVVVNATDPDVKKSVEQAVRSAAPYPMPSDPDARSQAKTFTASFTVK